MKSRGIILAVLIVVIFGGSAVLRQWFQGKEEPSAAERPVSGEVRKIVSRAPSITETLFAMGLGDRVVGATPWCDYPEAAQAIPRTGGLLDPNYEKILSLKPDLVILTTGMTSGVEQKKLRLEFGIDVLALQQRGIEDTFSAIRLIGGRCGAEQAARDLEQQLRARIGRVQAQTHNLEGPRVMVVIGREYSQPRIATVHIAGNQDNIFNDMLRLVNARNAYTGRTADYPEVSAEHIVSMDPEVIIEATGGMPVAADELAGHWQNLSQVRAVKDHRIYVFAASFEGRPGPRVVATLEHLARTLYPELAAPEEPHE